MNLQRVCVHEVGHFYLAYTYRPERAVSICISRQVNTDVQTGQEYASAGHVITFEPDYSLPKVLVSIRAAGLAAESLIYGESFEDLMNGASVRCSVKTDTDNAKRDLERAGLSPSTEDEFISFYWRAGFSDAVCMMRESVDKLQSIAEYCLANLDRDIPKSDLVSACNL
jgi:hypothetical protein